jgi:hypothetical protein
MTSNRFLSIKRLSAQALLILTYHSLGQYFAALAVMSSLLPKEEGLSSAKSAAAVFPWNPSVLI